MRIHMELPWILHMIPALTTELRINVSEYKTLTLTGMGTSDLIHEINRHFVISSILFS
jgi:hypothetical protein